MIPIPPIFSSEYYVLIDRFAQELKRGKLRSPHFATGERLIHEMKRGGLTGLWSDKDSDVGAFLSPFATPDRPQGYMIYNQEHGHYRQPSCVSIAFDDNLFAYHEAMLPVYVHFRDAYDVHTAADLVSFALIVSDVLAKTSSLKRRLESNKGLPLYLPDSRGLYACHAKWVAGTEEQRGVDVLRASIGGSYRVHDLSVEHYPVRIYVDSYLGEEELNGAQQRIRDDYAKLLSHPLTKQALAIIRKDVVFPVVTVAHQADLGFRQSSALNQHKEAYVEEERLKQGLRLLFQHHKWQWMFTQSDDVIPDLTQEDESDARRIPALASFKDRRPAAEAITPGHLPVRPGAVLALDTGQQAPSRRSLYYSATFLGAKPL